MQNDLIALREANYDDLETLCYWDKKSHVIASDPNDDWRWEIELKRKPSWRQQLIAELNGKPLGFIQIIDPFLEEEHYWGKVEENLRAIDIWIGESKNLNKGYGTRMMQRAVAMCFENKEIKAILVDPLSCNTDAHRFYQRFGFKYAGARVFGEDHCFIYRLERDDFNLSTA